MISNEALKKFCAKLSLISFFPADDDAVKALYDFVDGFASDDEQLDWLGKRMLDLYREWPGPNEMRACFCSKFKPRTGPNTSSSIYPDGIPSEKPEPMLALPPGVKAAEDPEEKEASIRALVEELERKRAARKRSMPVPVAPPTPDEIERVKQQQRENQARRKSLEDGDADPTTEG